MTLLDDAELADLRGEVQALMTTSCTLSRVGVPDVQTVCSIVPELREIRPTNNRQEPAERWLLQLPVTIDARPHDRLVTPQGTFLATIVRDPRTVDLARQVVCYQVTTADGSLAYLHANATVTCLRGGQQVGGPRRVQVAQAVSGATTPEGIPVPDLLYDVPDADWRTGDQATIVTIDGHTVAPRPRAFTVGVVRRVPAPLALTEVQLRGVGGGLNG